MSTDPSTASPDEPPFDPAMPNGPGRTSDQLKRPFLIGCLLCLGAILVVAGLVRLGSGGDPRPEGVGEQWLTALSDTTRDGVEEDALERTTERGDAALGAPLLPRGDTDGKSAFADLEVGKASIEGTGPGRVARVPYRLHQLVESGKAPTLRGTLVLARTADDSWRVVGVELRRAGEATPSEGGNPAGGAPAFAWVITLLVGAAVAGGCAIAITVAGREAEALGIDTSIPGASGPGQRPAGTVA